MLSLENFKWKKRQFYKYLFFSYLKIELVESEGIMKCGTSEKECL